jgi:hypothetical protein
MDKSALRQFLSKVGKLVLVVLLLPVHVYLTMSFYTYFMALESEVVSSFLLGVVAYLVLFFVFAEPEKFYQQGQAIVGRVVSISPGVSRYASLFLPFFSLVISLVYLSWSLLKGTGYYQVSYFFLLGLSLIHHLIFTVRTLRSEQGGLTIDYLFLTSLVYAVNLCLLAFLLKLQPVGFPLRDFLQTTFVNIVYFYRQVIVQFFALG